MDNQNIYHEKISSPRTEALFIWLTLIFLALFIWQATITGWRVLTGVFLLLAVFFLFYVVNYRTLVITITSKILCLKFGVFTWFISLDNIADIYPDEISLVRIGGAGIHFTSIGGRYRAMFNFLEYPRLVIRLKQKRGPVKDIVFSTQKPEEIERIIKGRLL
jgi:Ca2+/Na+ antiporter